MILSCKAHLTNNATQDIWNDSKASVISRMKDCIKLYEQYCEAYSEMNKSFDLSNEKPIEVSQIYVFGKFEKFTNRLKKVTVKKII